MVVVVLFLFIFGLVIGSFLNVVIYRTIHGESPMKGRSKCDTCGRQIAWYDNVPLLSFALLRGRCRRCHSPISWQNPAIELLTGVLFVWWYVVGFAFFQLTSQPFHVIQPIFWLMVGIFLLIIVGADAVYMIIPDFAVIGLAVLAVIYRVVLAVNGQMQWADFFLTMAMGGGLMVFLGLLWLFTKGRGMGFGDVKYALVMGWLLGWPRGLVGMFIAFVAGAIVGILLMLLGRKKMKAAIPFGPFLVIGTAVALLWGNQLWNMYMGLL